MKLTRRDIDVCKDINYQHASVQWSLKVSNTYQEACMKLNAAGYTTRQGNPWTVDRLREWNQYDGDTSKLRNRGRVSGREAERRMAKAKSEVYYHLGRAITGIVRL